MLEIFYRILLHLASNRSDRRSNFESDVGLELCLSYCLWLDGLIRSEILSNCQIVLHLMVAVSKRNTLISQSISIFFAFWFKAVSTLRQALRQISHIRQVLITNIFRFAVFSCLDCWEEWDRLDILVGRPDCVVHDRLGNRHKVALADGVLRDLGSFVSRADTACLRHSLNFVYSIRILHKSVFRVASFILTLSLRHYYCFFLLSDSWRSNYLSKIGYTSNDLMDSWPASLLTVDIWRNAHSSSELLSKFILVSKNFVCEVCLRYWLCLFCRYRFKLPYLLLPEIWREILWHMFISAVFWLLPLARTFNLIDL